MQYKQLRCLERKRCKRAPFVVAEFNFVYSRSKVFNNCSNLPAPEFAFRYIFRQGNNIKEFNLIIFHGCLTKHNNWSSVDNLHRCG